MKLTDRHRTYAHMAAGEAELLDVLQAERGPKAAREFERLLQSQHRSNERFARHHVVFDDVDVGGSEAAFRHGAGGGRVRHPPPRP